jgi:peptidoglycan/xylan/chitin deacetylase (PgdA/CDA1 family)
VISDRHSINSKLVALTFDDGPSEWTEPILDYLQAAGAYATFFVLGAALEGREAVVRRAAAENRARRSHLPSPRPVRIDGRRSTQRDRADGDRSRGDRAGASPLLACALLFGGTNELASLPLRSASVSSFIVQLTRAIERLRRPPTALSTSFSAAWRPARSWIHTMGCLGRPNGSAPTRQVTLDAVAKLVPELATRGFRAVTLSELLITD